MIASGSLVRGGGAVWQGVYGRVGRVAPQMALCLVLYEAFKQFFDSPAVPAAAGGKSAK